MSSIAEVAAHLDINTRNAADLIGRVITKAPRGSYDLDVVRVEYIRHLRSAAAGRLDDKPESEINGEYEKARKDKEAADRLEMQNAVMRKEQAPISEMTIAVSAAFARVRAKLLTIPSKVAPLVVGAPSIATARDLLSNAIYDSLVELASTRIGDWVAGAGGDTAHVDAVDAPAEADSKRVGGQGAKAKRGGVGRARKVVNGKG